jgi:hypothetical protein
MATITNFSQFIDNLGEIDTETIDCLYLAVKEGDDYGWFSMWEKLTGTYVKSITGNNTLWLATAEAKKLFLTHWSTASKEIVDIYYIVICLKTLLRTTRQF